MNFNYPRVLADVHDSEEEVNEKEVIQLDIGYFLYLKGVVRDERRGYGRDIYYRSDGPSMYNEDIPTVHRLGYLVGIKEIIPENNGSDSDMSDDISLPEGFLDDVPDINEGFEEGHMIELTFYNDYLSDDPDYPETGFAIRYFRSGSDLDLYMIPYEPETEFPGKLKTKVDVLSTGEHARKDKKSKTRKTRKQNKQYRSRSHTPQKTRKLVTQGGKSRKNKRKNKKTNRKTT